MRALLLFIPIILTGCATAPPEFRYQTNGIQPIYAVLPRTRIFRYCGIRYEVVQNIVTVVDCNDHLEDEINNWIDDW
tara:strand:+ start:517 stop:747 length:231 start_codon:yes stop_codon:yes gene_type:complete